MLDDRPGLRIGRATNPTSGGFTTALVPSGTMSLVFSRTVRDA